MALNNNPSFYFKSPESTQTPPASQVQNNYQTKEINTLTSDKFEKQENKGISKAAKIGILAAGAAAIAGGIYLIKSGKGKALVENIKGFFNKNKTNIQNETEQAINNATKSGEKTVNKISKVFTNNEGKVIENVKIERGNAILEDGSGFTGVFKGTSKNGNTIETVYENGYKKSVTLNGTLRREYNYLLSAKPTPPNPKEYRYRLTKLFNKAGNYKGHTAALYYKNGKLKEIRTARPIKGKVLLFSEEGKITKKGSWSFDF